ncbi:hypothetical protein LC612_01125 [Nostoc sp. CHAB 5834]|nr:hypothetical protein [Nostoc sp. CHAB 5834]
MSAVIMQFYLWNSLSILFEDALNHIRTEVLRKKNEPQRAQRTQRKKENLAQPHREMV